MAVVFVNPTWKRRFGLSRSAGIVGQSLPERQSNGRSPSRVFSSAPGKRMRLPHNCIFKSRASPAFRFNPIARSLADKRNNPQLSHWTVGETDPPSPCLRRGEQFPVWLRNGEAVSFSDGEPRPSLDELWMTFAPWIVALGKFNPLVQRRMIVEPELDEP